MMMSYPFLSALFKMPTVPLTAGIATSSRCLTSKVTGLDVRTVYNIRRIVIAHLATWAMPCMPMTASSKAPS